MLNEHQSTTKLMAKVDEISGHFVSLDEKVNQLQSNILEMKVMRSPPPLQPPHWLPWESKSSWTNAWMDASSKKAKITLLSLVSQRLKEKARLRDSRFGGRRMVRVWRWKIWRWKKTSCYCQICANWKEILNLTQSKEFERKSSMVWCGHHTRLNKVSMPAGKEAQTASTDSGWQKECHPIS